MNNDDAEPMARWLIETREMLDPNKEGITPGQKKRRIRMIVLLHAAEVDNIEAPEITESASLLILKWFDHTGKITLALNNSTLSAFTAKKNYNARYGATNCINIVRNTLHGKQRASQEQEP